MGLEGIGEISQRAVQCAESDALAVHEKLAALAGLRGEAGALPQRHRHFARLYYYVTERLVAHAACSDDPCLVYSAIVRFHEEYVRCVVTRIGKSRAGNRYCWRIYFAITGNGHGDIGPLRSWAALLAAIHAHTGPDLQAAFVALSGESGKQTCPAKRRRLRSCLLGRRSDDAFFAAALDYFAAEASRGACHVNRFHPVAVQRLRHIWLPLLQAVRWKAFALSRFAELSSRRIRCSIDATSTPPSLGFRTDCKE